MKSELLNVYPTNFTNFTNEWVRYKIINIVRQPVWFKLKNSVLDKNYSE